MPTTFSAIITWVKDLPFWEQMAFDLIVSGTTIDEEQLDLLSSLLLEDEGLKPKTFERKKLRFRDFQAHTTGCEEYKLQKISDVKNINALVEHQVLEFGPNLTVVYGDNAVGKSGYARILGRIGFSRGDREVLPNITTPYDPSAIQNVNVSWDCDGKVVTRTLDINRPEDKTPHVYAFDSTSVSVHVTDRNTIAFSPAGLNYLQELADLTDQVRYRLRSKILNDLKGNPVLPLLEGDSKIKKLVDNIKGGFSFSEAKNKLILSEDEKIEIRRLKEKVATYEIDGIRKKLIELGQKKEDLTGLKGDIHSIEKVFSKGSIETLNLAIQESKNHLEAANALGLNEFKDGGIAGIGQPGWHDFIHQALEFSLLQEGDYPQKDSVCLLCQQPLTAEAAKLIERIWGYIKSDVQINLNSAEDKLGGLKTQIAKLNTTFFDTGTAVYRLVSQLNSDTKVTIEELAKWAKDQQHYVEKQINERGLINYSPYEEAGEGLVSPLIRIIEKEISEWEEEQKNHSKSAKRLTELEHKAIASRKIDSLEQYSSSVDWFNKANNAGGSTRHITTQYNKFFDQLVTQEYLQLFKDTLHKLGRKLNVVIDTKASKSHVIKQLTVLADPTVPSTMTRPDKVLSEGEKRAVAFADFLTEAKLDNVCKAIVLDDPITSLDIHWGNQISTLLVEEAKSLQVIIFTHDLPFLYQLVSAAEKNGTGIQVHSIEKGQIDGKPGYVLINTSPAAEKSYRRPTKAIDCYAKAKTAGGEEQLRFLREGFAALRSSYEAVIIYDILNEVIVRFDSRIRYVNLNEIIVDYDLFREITERYEFCSRYMEGHLHADSSPYEPISIDLLKNELGIIDRVKKRVKELKQAIH